MSLIKLYVALGLVTAHLVVVASGAEITAVEKNALEAARQGEVVLLSELWPQQRELPLVPIKISDAHGPQFLLSDKPEYFYTGNGIALQEEVKPGVARLYIYHVPEPTNGPKTISAVIENLGSRPLKFRFLRRAFPKPGRDYQRIGKAGLVEFFNSKPEKTNRRLAPGGRMVIDPQMDAATATTDELAHGFYEFEINQPARITVFQRSPEQSSLTVIDQLPRLPFDLPGRKANGAGRGLFLTSDFKVVGEPGFVLDTAHGPMRLVLADGRTDPAIKGRDGIEQMEAVKDSGNYGVLYRIRIKYASSDGRGLALLMTKSGKGGQWCGSQAAAVQVNRGIWAGGTVAIPADRVSYGNPGETVLIQKFPPLRHGRTGTIDILYSPPGASCMPTPLLLVPY